MASPDPDVSFDVPSATQTVDEVRRDESNNSVHVHDVQSRQRRDDAHHVSFRDTPSPVTRRSSFDRTNNNPHGSQNTLYNHGDNHYNHFMPPPPPPIYHTRIKPDMYDGNSSYEQYASHFEDCSELSGWDNRTKVLMLAASLRGAARSFYMSLTEDERRNYITLTTRLSARFGSNSKHQCMWLDKLENRRRAKGESIASLADDLRQLCQKAYSDLDHRSQEKLALNQLYKLVSIEMKCRCMDHNCLTVNEAVSVIERYESILGAPSTSNIRAVDSGKCSDIESVIKRIEARLDKIETSVVHKPKTHNNKSERFCYGCNAPDHLWASCPQNANRGPRRYRANGTQSANNDRSAQLQQPVKGNPSGAPVQGNF